MENKINEQATPKQIVVVVFVEGKVDSKLINRG